MITLKYKLTKRDLYEYVIQVLLKKLLEFGFAISIFGIFFFTVVSKSITLFVVALICLICSIMVAPMTVWEIQRNARAMEDDDSETTLTFDKNILMQEDKIKMEIAYSQVLRICETKHLYVLMIGKNNGIVIPKASCDEAIFDNLTKTSHTENGISTLKTQYFSQNNTIYATSDSNCNAF